ncbi:hypothetical protein K502DRAFT_363729 [Neoconidiobolus thromboides FSU 785]|nr:hypothetical protein K502DRAFT_363729 [Neoconidiobolus thromboides FSU 785]
MDETIQKETRASKIMTELWESIIVGGVNNSVMLIMNLSFLFLFLSLLLLLYVTSGNYHVMGLIFIAFCLFASINWFIFEMNVIKAKEINEKIQNEEKAEVKPTKNEKKNFKRRSKKAP